MVTTVTFDETGGEGNERLILDQVAEKDLLHRADSRVYIEGDGPDLMKQTYVVFQRGQKPVRGTKKFARYNPTAHVGLQAGGEAAEKSDTAKRGEQGGLKQDKGGGGGGLKVPTTAGRKMSCQF